MNNSVVASKNVKYLHDKNYLPLNQASAKFVENRKNKMKTEIKCLHENAKEWWYIQDHHFIHIIKYVLYENILFSTVGIFSIFFFFTEIHETGRPSARSVWSLNKNNSDS